MTNTDRDAFSVLLADVFGFYRRDVTAFAADVWWRTCQTYSLAQLRAAFGAHCRDPERGAFAPMPADVVRHLEGRHDDRALLAWHRVLLATSTVGHYASIDFGDPTIHAAIVDLGGWRRLCTLELDELDFARRRFCESYRAYLAAGGVPNDTPRYLAGEHETANAALGYTVERERDVDLLETDGRR